MQQANAERESLLVEMASLRPRQLPLDKIRPSHLGAFSHLIGAKLRDPSSRLEGSYLRTAVDGVGYRKRGGDLG